jgi:hypothetical protein
MTYVSNENRKKGAIIFTCAEDCLMNITKYSVKINKTPTKGFPIKTGLIFTTNHLSSI